VDCVRRVYAEEGFRAFYKGLGASYLGISLSHPKLFFTYLTGIAESSIQFVLYEKMKSVVLVEKTEKGIINPTLANGEYMALAGTAKLIAAICTYPHEVSYLSEKR
jgi:solute carrier family 25, member 33/36